VDDFERYTFEIAASGREAGSPDCGSEGRKTRRLTQHETELKYIEDWSLRRTSILCKTVPVVAKEGHCGREGCTPVFCKYCI